MSLNKLFSAFTKEFLLLIRDIPGLLILFIMPVTLVLIVTVAQENASKKTRERKTNVLFVDEVPSEFTKSLEENIVKSGIYNLIKSTGKNKLNESTAMKLIAKGDYKFAIVIARHDNAVMIMADPAMYESYRTSIIGTLTYFIHATQSRYSVESLLIKMNPSAGSIMGQLMNDAIKHVPPVREIYPTREKSTIKPTLSQNCIPGFVLFAMFFIVIPLSGSIINEKKEGSFQRLKTLPVPISITLSAKVLLYLIVCVIQFILMLITGIWLLPGLFGLSHFYLGHEYLSILLITIASGLSAIGFGLLVGTFATTHAQAALFGSVMVVILSIISGVFLPIHLFPKAIVYLSLISPIRWGIDGYLEIFIRQNGLLTIIPHILFLLLFFVFAMMISIFNFAKQN